MEERVKFVLEFFDEWPENMSALCRKYGISRKTGYKWLKRYDASNLASLQDRSRRPRTRPQAIPDFVEEAIVEVRKRRPRWGPKKLRAILQKWNPETELPSVSTFANVIKRNGLVRPRRKRPTLAPFTAPFEGCNAPNDVWCADFKGHFRTGRNRCYPLTISDGFSRFLLRCDGLTRPRHKESRRVFESAFSEFGLPTAIRTDNGPPFASTTVGGLSRLAVWWMRLGIRPERIAPGKPQENGRHERMHRTLKDETAQPPASSARAQQRRFDFFRRDYNEERPHEALNQTPPASWYEPSPRQNPNHLPDVEYPLGFYTYLVPDNGILAWRGQNLYISDCLAHEYIGIDQVEDDTWNVHFCSTMLGRILRDRTAKKRFKFEREKYAAPRARFQTNPTRGEQLEP